jgi:hypothetical protein
MPETFPYMAQRWQQATLWAEAFDLLPPALFKKRGWRTLWKFKMSRGISQQRIFYGPRHDLIGVGRVVEITLLSLKLHIPDGMFDNFDMLGDVNLQHNLTLEKKYHSCGQKNRLLISRINFCKRHIWLINQTLSIWELWEVGCRFRINCKGLWSGTCASENF